MLTKSPALAIEKKRNAKTELTRLAAEYEIQQILTHNALAHFRLAEKQGSPEKAYSYWQECLEFERVAKKAYVECLKKEREFACIEIFSDDWKIYVTGSSVKSGEGSLVQFEVEIPFLLDECGWAENTIECPEYLGADLTDFVEILEGTPENLELFCESAYAWAVKRSLSEYSPHLKLQE